MEKELLLLGILLSHNVHGYELSEMLKHNLGTPIAMKKSNAYRLLNAMEKDGLITHTEAKAGNRPVRRVYSISGAGEKAFKKLLRENIAAYAEPEFPSMVGIDLISLLPNDEAIQLLKERLEIIERKEQAFAELPEEIMGAHPTAAYLKRFYTQEVVWLREFISHLENK